MESARGKLKELYSHFGRGDMAAVLAMCDDAITFQVPGNSAVSGTWKKSGFGDMIGAVMTISAGSFREEVVDVMVGSGFAVAYLHHSFERAGAAHEYLTVHLWGLGDTQFTSWRELPADLHAFEAA